MPNFAALQSDKLLHNVSVSRTIGSPACCSRLCFAWHWRTFSLISDQMTLEHTSVS